MTDTEQSNPEKAQNEVPTNEVPKIDGRAGLAAELNAAIAEAMKVTERTGTYPSMTPGEWLQEQLFEVLKDPAVIREVQWETAQEGLIKCSWDEVQTTLVALEKVLRGGVSR